MLEVATGAGPEHSPKKFTEDHAKTPEHQGLRPNALPDGPNVS